MPPKEQAPESESSKELAVPEDFPKVGTRVRANMEGVKWYHGVIEFDATRTQTKYLLVPEECEDAMEILKVALQAWNLKLPQLLVQVDGGHDIPDNWFDWLLHQEAWKTPGESEESARTNFMHAVERIFKAIVSACAECDAWVHSFVDMHGGGMGFEGKADMFGRARRSEEMGKNVLHWAQHSIKDFDGLFGEEEIRRCAVEVGQEPLEYASYPRLKSYYCTKPEGSKRHVFNGEPGGGVPKGLTVLQGNATHLIIYPKKARLPWHSFINEALAKVVPTAMLLAHGEPSNGYATHFCMNVINRMPVITLRHTGGVADVLAEAVINRRSTRPGEVEPRVQFKFEPGGTVEQKERWTIDYALPKGIRDSQFIVLDAQRDSIERVVDKLIQCVSLVDDDESRQLGFKQHESDRLQSAWDMFLSFEHNAERQRRLSVRLQYLIIFVSLMTSFVAVLHDHLQSHSPASINTSAPTKERSLRGSGVSGTMAAGQEALASVNWLEVLKWAVMCLPLFSTFLLSCNSKFSPRAKYVQLKVAASSVLCEIYEYRSRVSEYTPRVLARNTSMQPMAPENQSEGLPEETPGRSKSKGKANEKEPADEEKKKTKNTGLVATRRGAFAENLEMIQSDLMQGDIREGSLIEPPPDAFSTYKHKNLVGHKDERGSKPADTETKSTGYIKLTQSTPEPATQGGLQALAVDMPIDDGFALINAEDYINFRLRPTLTKFSKMAPRLETIIDTNQIIIFISTGSLALLAMLGLTKWVPVLVTLIGAISAIMDFEMYVARLALINGAQLTLKNLLIWWESLSLIDRRLPESKQYLVDTTEQSVMAELSWAKTAAKKKPKSPGASDPDEKDKESGKEKEKGNKQQ